MRALIVALLVLVASPAYAFEVATDGETVVVRVDGVTQAGAPVIAEDFLDVPLTAGAPAPGFERLHDPLVRKVEVGDAAHRRIRIKFRIGGRRARAVAAAATIRAVDGGLEIVLPRDPEAIATVPAAAPTAPVAPTAPTAAAPIAAAPTPAAPIATTAPAPAAPAAAPVVAAPAPAAPTLATAEAPTPARRLGSAPQGSLPWGSLILILGLAGAAALVLKAKKKSKRAQPALLSTLEIRQSISLGPKARAVLVQAGGREMLIAIDAKGVHLLDSWSRDEIPAPSNLEEIPGPDEWRAEGSRVVTLPQPPRPTAPRHSSPAVAGLVQLRAGTQQTDDEISEPAWSEWLSALRGKRGGAS